MPELKKFVPVELRQAGLDEKWLQAQIRHDSTLLGLGELEIVGSEHPQPGAGRIDFLMRDREAETYYEVEVMLGAVDPSHIIRTIEYWDIERQRHPQYQHRAVIVAEHMTRRFFNVVRLLNRSVPMIAVQLCGFRVDEHNIGLHAVTVLDVVEELPDEQLETVDENYWKKRANPASLAVVDKILDLLSSDEIKPRRTESRTVISCSTTDRQFCWFFPNKKFDRCNVQLRLDREARDDILKNLQDGGIDASRVGTSLVAFSITSKEVDGHSHILRDTLRAAEEASKAE